MKKTDWCTLRAKDELIGQFATIKITKADTYALMGVLDEGKEDRI